MIDAKSMIGTHDVLFITLDSLRYDVACKALELGKTPYLASILPNGMWEKRHTPGNYTLPAHLSFFAGFLPTPEKANKSPRLFAVQFPQNDSITSKTAIFKAPNIVSGFAQKKYHTVCIGGVGFFNKSNYLGRILPNFFLESHWGPEMGVRGRRSTEKQVQLAIDILEEIPNSKHVFLFINISAIHQPSCIFLRGAKRDSQESQLAALQYVDSHLERLFITLQRRSPTLVIVCSDHGEAFGEDGYFGHRLSHSVVWNVPYAELILPMRKKVVNY